MKFKIAIIASIALTVLTACGGGGPVTTNSVEPLRTVSLFNTSYENMKSQGLLQLPISSLLNQGTNYSSAWAIGDFFGDGSTIIMLSDTSNSVKCLVEVNGQLTAKPSCLGPAPLYIKDEVRAVLRFYKLTSSNTLVDTGKTAQGCLTPRKALVADFNQDGHPDIFLACHGWDTMQPLFPGELNRLLLNDSEGKGNFIVSDVGVNDRNADGSGYFHGASAADVNGDGYPDIVLTDNFRTNIDPSAGKQVVFLINQPSDPGVFTVDNNRITGLTEGPYFSVELVDLNNDGKVDMIAAGAEYPANADTVILYNNGSGFFGTQKTVIPADSTYNTPLDFTVVTNAQNEKVILLSRVSSDYRNQSVQRYNINTTASSTVWYQNSISNWIEWWLPSGNGSAVIPYSDKNPNIALTP